MFSLCLSVHCRKYPSLWSHVPSGEGGTPVSGPMSLLGSTPVLSQVMLGGTPVLSQVLVGVPQDRVPIQDWGIPLVRTRVAPGQDYGTPSSQDWGTSQPGLGYSMARTGVPPVTGHAAGGTPRAVSHRSTFLFLGGLSLHLNHLIAERVSAHYWQFGTLPIGIFLSNLDSGQLETSLMTSYCHF